MPTRVQKVVTILKISSIVRAVLGLDTYSGIKLLSSTFLNDSHSVPIVDT
jgi:hypothetical protein